MKYYVENGIHIAEVPVEDFVIEMVDAPKKSAAKDNYCNAGYFGKFDEGKTAFTLPAGHVVCDYNADEKWTRYYCEERGSFNGDKFTFDCSTWSFMNQFQGKAVSTLTVSNNIAAISDLISLPNGLDYAISGVPIMRDGKDVIFATYVKGQGWGSSSLYATWSMFVGLKEKSAKTIYVMAMKTTTSNMIRTAEAYKKFKALGLYDVIKLDGGGSTYMKVDGKAVAATDGNRRINTIILFGEPEKQPVVVNTNPYKVPTVVLRKGNGYREFNKWLQYQLSSLGYPLEVDGYFGNDTLAKVKLFQRNKGLVVDGMVGPATRAVLLAEK